MDRVVCRGGAYVLVVVVALGAWLMSASGALASQSRSGGSGAGALSYRGGPVVHSSRPYLIFWTPPGQSIASGSQALMARFFSDVAADSGESSNTFGVLRQYYDRTGFADYRQTFDPARQVLLDTQPYPPHRPSQCPDVSATYPTCISDEQMQSELQRLITAEHLPTAGSFNGVSARRSAPARLSASAPIYFVILPADVAFCYGTYVPGLIEPQCTYSNMGGYHQVFDARGQAVLYAPIAMDPLRGVALPQGIPGPCQLGGTAVPQKPNGDQADCVIDVLLHEDSETITDPIQGTPHTGWAQNPNVQGEVADECGLHGPFDPTKGFNPNAFVPTLGGSELAGTLYTQEINGHPYYTQSVWSNGDRNCEMRPTTGLIVPRFHVRGHRTSTRPIVFNPRASKSMNTLSSATWNFGDRSKPAFFAGHTALKRVEHRYRRAGRYAVTLTLVDSRGNLKTTSQRVTIHAR
jgi:PKD domain